MDIVYIVLVIMAALTLGWYIRARQAGGPVWPDVDWSHLSREVGLYLVGLFVLLVFTITLWEVLHVEVPQANRDVTMILVGVISTKTSTVIDFFFGSSKGSADKDKVLAEVAKTP